MEAALVESLREDLRAKVGSIRDPDTGEFPLIVVNGYDFDSLSISVEGSEKVVQLVKERLGLEGADTKEEYAGDRGSNLSPVAFLCHAGEDKETVRRLATDLRCRGVEVFLDEWEIRSGDSLRQKIDEGIERCTHFIAVLSPASTKKPWVNAEIDAGFVRRVRKEAVFIPLRLDLDVTELPPLLQGLSSPALRDYETDLERLVSDIHGISRKPPIGPTPPAKAAATGKSGLSPAAETIARLFIQRSEHGDTHDPVLDVEALRNTGLLDDDILDAVDELEGQGCARKRGWIGCDELGFGEVYPEGELFAKFDCIFGSSDAAADALLIATKLLDEPNRYLNVPVVAANLGWEPRRMNPALHYLVNRELVDYSKACGAYPWATHSIERTAATRRFVRSWSGQESG